jgi:hypothetical protein
MQLATGSSLLLIISVQLAFAFARLGSMAWFA